ncbi:MAG TPA: carbohydrate ABC transporter permease, partial [Coriobacteriia bacterium]|nr:carbohydrate ABC transporter permease [Coriobacteriia bacterium]
ESATLDQFRAAIGQSRILSSLLYSGLLAAGTAVVVVILGSLAAYAVTQWTFPGVGGFLGVTLFTQLLPQSAVLVPLYLAWKTLGLTGTLPGLGVAYVFLFLPVGVWMLVGFFQSLPKELTEAGLIDGAGRLRILFSIVLPVVRPALGAVAVYTVISCWGEFLFALVFLRSDHATSTVALASLVGEHNPNIGPLMAAATLVTLPPLIVFFLMQRQFIAGLTGGSSK